MLAMLELHPTFGADASELLQAQPWLTLLRSNDANLPILPTSANPQRGTKKILLDFVIRRTLASLSAPGSRHETPAVVKVDDEEYILKGTCCLSLGMARASEASSC